MLIQTFRTRTERPAPVEPGVTCIAASTITDAGGTPTLANYNYPGKPGIYWQGTLYAADGTLSANGYTIDAIETESGQFEYFNWFDTGERFEVGQRYIIMVDLQTMTRTMNPEEPLEFLIEGLGYRSVEGFWTDHRHDSKYWRVATNSGSCYRTVSSPTSYPFDAPGYEPKVGPDAFTINDVGINQAGTVWFIDFTVATVIEQYNAEPTSGDVLRFGPVFYGYCRWAFARLV